MLVQLAAHPLRWQLITELAGGDYRVRELVTRIGQPQNLISYHLRLLRDGGLVCASRSSFNGRDSYYHLDLQRCADLLTATGPALHPGLHLQPTDPSARWDTSASVLFMCTGNSARSAIAQALLNQNAGGQLRVVSAGTRPKESMHPNTIRVLHRQYGIDITGQRPRGLDDLDLGLADFDYVITLCDKARETCPELPDHGGHRHWSIPDPCAGNASYPMFVDTAAEINIRVHYLQAALAAPD